MTSGEKYKLVECMKICAEAGVRSSQRGTNFNSQQALIYNTISLTMYWVMAVLGEETQNNPMYKNFEQVLANAKEFGVNPKILPDDYKG